MPWIKLNDNAPDHPKVAGLSDRAFRVWIRSLCYAAQFQTDGIVPPAFLATVPRRIYLELVEAGLWISSQSTVAIHDYLKHQSSKELVTEKKPTSLTGSRVTGPAATVLVTRYTTRRVTRY